MSEWLKVIILGIVEGVTEFLPISSTGHLLVATELLRFQNSLNGTFEVFIQLGAILAVVFYYRSDLWQQARRLPTDRATQRFWLAVLVGTLPAGLIGFALRDQIKEVFFGNLVIVALALIVGGVIFLLVERRPPAKAEQTEDIADVSLRQAVLIGIVQICALIPGVSRSGSSIIGGMYAGLNRHTATQFSFYLAMPILGAATVFEFVDALPLINGNQLLYLLLGAAVSAIVAWLSIDWLLRYVSSNNFLVFGYYRILAGLAILLVIAAGIV